jgi:hypothetical protein
MSIGLVFWLTTLIFWGLFSFLGLGAISFVLWELPWSWDWTANGRFALTLYWLVCIIFSLLAASSYVDSRLKQFNKWGK